jgi:hypothetical protein
MKSVGIRFGQKPKPRVSVNPQAGQVGTTFFFNTVGFDPSQLLAVLILDQHNRRVYDGQIATDEQGSISHTGFHWPTSGWAAGEYRFVVAGKYKKEPVTVTQYFRLVG